MVDELTWSELEVMMGELFELTPGMMKRSIYFDLSKLTEECGEVAECLNKSRKTDEDLGDELSDVMAVCMIIALKKGIDMRTAMRRKQEKRVKKLLKKYHS